MLIRIFCSKDFGIEKYLNFVRLELAPAAKPWTIERCNPLAWIPTSPAAIHIYLEKPLRLATPWAAINVFAHDYPITPPPWAWTQNEMDLVFKLSELTERKTALDLFRRIFRTAQKSKQVPALPLEPAKSVMPPKVAIITVTRNRPEWWANMLQNVMKQTWPVSRLEWILVDDGDEDKRLVKEVDTFMEKNPGILLRYLELQTPKTIGAKRNAAVAAAGGDVDIFVCMDDDDHYPKDSVGRRVTWLNRDLRPKKKQEPKQAQIGYCSTLPMYDLTRYISAMNVPELENGPADRVSEATLIFTRDAWLARPFPEVSMAEGLGFLKDREEITVEMPPKDIIVSFLHKGNTSSRRIPADQEPNGCHYGLSNDYFTYLHQIGGGMTL